MEFKVTVNLPDSVRPFLLAHAATLGTADLLSFLTEDQQLQLAAQSILKNLNTPAAPAAPVAPTAVTSLRDLANQQSEACPVPVKTKADQPSLKDLLIEKGMLAPVAPNVSNVSTEKAGPATAKKKIEAEIPIRSVTVPTRKVGEPRIDWLRRALPAFLEENPGANASQVSEWIFKDKSKKTLTATAWALRQLAADGIIVEKQGSSDLHYTLPR